MAEQNQSNPDNSEEETDLDLKVDSLLDQARVEYDRQKYPEAIRIAKETLDINPTGRAQVLITLSHCAQKETEQARKSLENVPPGRRQGCIAQCLHFGVDLETGSQPE